MVARLPFAARFSPCFPNASLTDYRDASAPPQGLRSSRGLLLQDELVEGEDADRSAQAGVLALEVLDPLRLADLEAAVLYDLRDLLALAKQDLRLAQLGDGLLGAAGPITARRPSP
jgi:hypothetical protein